MADSTVKLLWKTDRASLSETLRANEKIEKSLEDATKDATKRIKELQAAQAKLNKEVLLGAKAYEDIQEEVAKLAKEERQLSEVVRGAGGGGAGGKGLGDVGRLESVTSGLTGLTGVAGLQPIGEAAGLIDAAGAAFSTMNPVVMATGGIIAGAAAAFALLNAQAKEGIAEYNAQVDAQRELAQAIGGGLTTEQAAEQVQKWNTELERQIPLLEQRAAEQEKFDSALGKAADFTGLFGQIEAVNQQYDTQKQTVEELRANIERYNSAIETGAFATNDAAIAEEELKNQREKEAAAASRVALTEAGYARDFAQLKAESASFYQEDITGRLKSNEVRKAGLEAELSALEASGNLSQEVATQMASLYEQMENLDKATKLLKETAKTAPSREAEREREKARQEADRAAEQSAREAEQRADRLHDIQTGTQEKLADLQTKFARDEEDARIDMYDKLEDIRRKAEVEEGKAAEQRDFLRLADTRDAAKDEARAVERENERAHRDRLRELQYANTDVMLEQRRALQDLQQSNRQQVMAVKAGATASLSIMTNWAKAFERIFSGVPLPGGGGGGGGRNSSGLQDLAAVL